MAALTSLFKPKKPSIIGLDISSTAIKLLELTRSGKTYKVESYAVEPLPPNAVVEKNIADVDAVGDVIKRVVKRSGAKSKLAAAAVPGSAVITKVITMPANLSDDEMESQIQLEADQYVPFPLEEVNMDFEVIGPTEDNPDAVDVLLAASRSENVDARIAAIELGGLTPEIIDIEPYTLETAFELISHQVIDEGEDRVVAIVDIGATITCINVLYNAKTIFTHEQVFGGKQLTEEIQRRYGLSYEEAGMAKRQGGLPDNYIPEVLDPFKEAMAQQVSRSLQLFYAGSEYGEVDHILLAGGSASIPGIEDLITEKIGTACNIANPFAHMSLASRVKAQALTNDAPAMLIACGLAMRSFS